MFERADASRCRLHRWSFSRPFRPHIHHLTTNSGIAYSSTPYDGLKHRGPITPNSTNSTETSLLDRMPQIYFQSELQPHSAECTFPVTLDLSNFHSFVLAIPPHKFESGVDVTEPVQTA